MKPRGVVGACGATAEGDWLGRFVAAREAAFYSPGTIALYVREIREFASFVSCKWSDVRQSHFKEYVRHLLYREPALARATIIRTLSAVRGFFNWLYVNELLDSNPSQYIPKLRKEHRIPRSVPSRAEMNAVLDTARRAFFDCESDFRYWACQEWAVLELMYSTGARLSEVANLSIADVDFTKRCVLLKGKGRKERLAFLGAQAIDSIEQLLAERRHLLSTSPHRLRLRNPRAPLFLTYALGRIKGNNIHRVVKRLFRNAGIDERSSAHSVRHAFATHMLNDGAGIRAIQEMLGHSNIATTTIYLHIAKRRVLDVYNRAHPRA